MTMVSLFFYQHLVELMELHNRRNAENNYNPDDEDADDSWPDEDEYRE